MVSLWWALTYYEKTFIFHSHYYRFMFLYFLISNLNFFILGPYLAKPFTTTHEPRCILTSDDFSYAIYDNIYYLKRCLLEGFLLIAEGHQLMELYSPSGVHFQFARSYRAIHKGASHVVIDVSQMQMQQWEITWVSDPPALAVCTLWLCSHLILGVPLPSYNLWLLCLIELLWLGESVKTLMMSSSGCMATWCLLVNAPSLPGSNSMQGTLFEWS